MIQGFLIAAALFGSAAPPRTVHAGIEAWQRADYSAAVAIWRPLAEQGNVEAAFNLGQAYRLGRGVPINIAAAVTWYQRAALKGHPDAQATLGLLLFENGDQARGLRWLEASAEQGEARSLLVYGTALVNGDGVKRDPVRGYAYVSRAAAQGLPAAKETLAQLDQLLPLEDRRKGVAIAAAKATGTIRSPAKAGAQPKTRTGAAAPPGPRLSPGSASPAAAPIPATGAWRIQLGAFAQRASAEALFQGMSARLAGKRPFYVSAGTITRLQVGPFESRASAQAACTALRGQACFAVPAK